MNKYDASTGVPEVFLTRVRQLIAKEHVSKSDFVELCLLAQDLIDNGKIDIDVRSRIAYHITGFWIAHKNIDDDDLLNAIGGQFGEWEIYFSMDELDTRKWSQVKEWIAQASEKYVNGDADE